MRITKALFPIFALILITTACVPSADIQKVGIEATEICLSRIVNTGMNQEGFAKCVSEIANNTSEILADYVTGILQTYTDDALNHVFAVFYPDMPTARSGNLDRTFAIEQIAIEVLKIPD